MFIIKIERKGERKVEIKGKRKREEIKGEAQIERKRHVKIKINKILDN